MKFESPTPPEEKGKSPQISRRQFLKLAGKAALGAAAAVGGLQKLEKAAEAFETDGTEKYYRDWQEFKRIVTESDIQENFRWAKEKFGRLAEPLLFKPAFDLQLFLSMQKEEAGGMDFRTNERGTRLLKEASQTYRRFWSVKNIEAKLKKREAKEGLGANFKGFDALYGTSNERFRQKLEETIQDRRWLYGNIGTFIIINARKKRAHRDIAGEAYGQGIQSMLIKTEKQAVVLYKYPGVSVDHVLKTTAHEIGHHQDWENNNRLPIHERLLFLKEVTVRFESPDRMRTPYIDEVAPIIYGTEQGQDPKAILYGQIREYWASVIEAYTTDQIKLREVHPADYQLAKRWFTRLNQDYS